MHYISSCMFLHIALSAAAAAALDRWRWHLEFGGYQAKVTFLVKKEYLNMVHGEPGQSLMVVVKVSRQEV